jgi:hypothetical protein
MTAGEFSAVVDVTRPGLGVHQFRWTSELCEWNLMRIGAGTADKPEVSFEASWKPSDVYVRGFDLVAAYREPAELPFNVQLYSRVIEGQAAERLVLESIISVHTRTWEAYPIVCVDSSLPKGKMSSPSDDDVRVWRHDNWGYAELSFPGDFELVANNKICSTNAGHWQYGPAFMERGVIRRLRLRGVVMRGDLPIAIDQLQSAFAATAPPLTA